MLFSFWLWINLQFLYTIAQSQFVYKKKKYNYNSLILDRTLCLYIPIDFVVRFLCVFLLCCLCLNCMLLFATPGYLFIGVRYALTCSTRQCLLQFWLVLRTARTFVWLVHTGNFAKFVERERAEKALFVFSKHQIKADDWTPSFFLSLSLSLLLSYPLSVLLLFTVCLITGSQIHICVFWMMKTS